MNRSIAQYLLDSIKTMGVADVFGVPGDFSFPLTDAVCNDPELRWIGNCNELNAAYAADGYARIKGFAALSTTFGVGELSALCGVAGAYAEHLPVIHIVGIPPTKTMLNKRIVHHTLGTGNFEIFKQAASSMVCASATLTPENAIPEIKRTLEAAVYHHRPVYFAIPLDYGNLPVIGREEIGVLTIPRSDQATLREAVAAIHDKLTKSASPAALAGYLIRRLNLQDMATRLIEKTDLPFATMFMDKTTLDESLKQYAGIYDGRIMNQEVRDFIENSDCVLNIGALWSDFNTGAFSANIDRTKMISIMHHHVTVGYATYCKVEMEDVINGLLQLAAPKNAVRPEVKKLGQPQGIPGDNITPDYFYPALEKFLKPGDIVVAETGTVSMGLGFAKMPENSIFLNQTLWGSIGWATPAALGAALGAPGRRVVLITGEGSHQLTVQEVGQFARFGLKPVIIVLNNDGYLIERLLCENPDIYYNNLAQWQYSRLPEAFGCEGWLSVKVTKNGELEDAFKKTGECDCAAYIEVCMDKMAASELAMRIHDSIKNLYS
ncbi:MAG: thiamine pyrophosphate-binding protein [Victivallaceae bacterium]|jgi:indolepyruvate decarboxylase